MKPLPIIYTKNNCMSCKMMKERMDANGTSYDERNVEEDPKAMATVKELGYERVPILVDGETVINGFNPDQIDELAT